MSSSSPSSEPLQKGASAKGQPAQPGARGAGASRAGAGILENLESLALVLILTLILRGSVMEAYVIPTGSMAPTLLGRHASLVCPNCGYRYDRGIPSSQEGSWASRPRQLDLSEVYCPNDLYPATVARATGLEKLAWVVVFFGLSLLAAGAVYGLGRWVYHDEQFGKIGALVSCLLVFYLLTNSLQPFRGGDRILVSKLSYRFHHPSRWDVIVFKSPEEISRQFIKRLVAVPGDRVQILAGDVIVNGRISRKPEHVQRRVWRMVYDQQYQSKAFNRSVWLGPSGRYEATPREVVLRGRSRDGGRAVDPVEVQFARRLPAGGREPVLHDILDHSGYNRGLGRNVVGDLRVEGRASLTGEQGAGWVGIDHDAHQYRLRLVRAASGSQRVELLADGEVKDSVAVAPGPDADHAFELSKVDYLLRGRVDGLELGPVDLWSGLDEVELGSRSSRVLLGAAGVEFRARGLRIHRDLYYTGSVLGSARPGGAAIVLGPGEYFVLGDNSPDSRDGRDWRPPAELYGLVGEVLVAEGERYRALEGRLRRYRLKAVPELLDAAFRSDADGQQRVVKLLAVVAPEGPGRRAGEDPDEALDRWAEWWRREERAPSQIVPEENLLGKPFLVFWPLPRIALIR